MKKTVLFFGLLFSTLTMSAQDYFPIISGSYWIYDVYYDGIYTSQDSVVYNNSIVVNDTTFHLFIHNYIENVTVTDKDTFFLYNNFTDNNTIMLSNRNSSTIDSAVFAKHDYLDKEWWVYKKIFGNDTIRVDFTDNYSVSSGSYSDCFIQGDEYYFAPNVGIIKIKLWNEESYYDLTSYYIPVASSISVPKSKNFEIFPNPAYDYISFNSLKYGNYQIFDLNGRIVQSGQITSSRINISELNNGIYIVSVEIDGTKKGLRFSKK